MVCLEEQQQQAQNRGSHHVAYILPKFLSISHLPWLIHVFLGNLGVYVHSYRCPSQPHPYLVHLLELLQHTCTYHSYVLHCLNSCYLHESYQPTMNLVDDVATMNLVDDVVPLDHALFFFFHEATKRYTTRSG